MKFEFCWMPFVCVLNQPLTLSILYHPRFLNRPQARLGKAYYQLGMLRDAEKQFLSSLKQQEMVLTYLELAKVYLKLDQPNSALDMCARPL